jgi:hypothetical protein
MAAKLPKMPLQPQKSLAERGATLLCKKSRKYRYIQIKFFNLQ